MNNKLLLVLKLIVAGILVQTLYFKFSAHPDSVHIFTVAGLEPQGRIGIGVLELVAAILLLIPKTTWMGAVLALGLICGAIMIHLTKLGIEVNNDGGLLFGLAVIIFVLSLMILWDRRNDIPFINIR